MTCQGFNPISGAETEFTQFCKCIERTEDFDPSVTNENENPSQGTGKKLKRKVNFKQEPQGSNKKKCCNENAACMSHGKGQWTQDCTVLKAQVENMKASHKAQHPSQKKPLNKNKNSMQWSRKLSKLLQRNGMNANIVNLVNFKQQKHSAKCRFKTNKVTVLRALKTVRANRNDCQARIHLMQTI